MIKEGVITPSTSELASPLVLVPKPDGSLRFCVDYRRVNAVSHRDPYPIPRIDECIDSLGDANLFTMLDANSGFWQVPMDAQDRGKTTFTSHVGLFEFRRMPFGLTNAPATFQRALDIALGHRLYPYLIRFGLLQIWAHNMMTVVYYPRRFYRLP